MFKVDSTKLRDEYETVLNAAGKFLWEGVLAEAEKVVNEKGESVKFNVGDLCNTLTNLAQAHRRDNQ